MEQQCMNCREIYNSNDLIWINDLYGFPYKEVCDKCYDEVNEYIKHHDYGRELSHYELYGD